MYHDHRNRNHQCQNAQTSLGFEKPFVPKSDVNQRFTTTTDISFVCIGATSLYAYYSGRPTDLSYNFIKA